MKDFSKGLNGISADMLKSVAQISAESRQKATEQAQQHKQGLAGRFESFRPVPADQIEKTPRAIERVYAGMAPAYKAEQNEETLAERVAALKTTTKHQPIPHDSVLLEPKITLKGGAKRKMEAESTEITDEDKAFLEQLNTEAKHDPVGKEDADVNNDGKVNSSDSYLKNRRQAISAMIKKKGMKEETEQPVEEGWDDMVKAAKDSMKNGPKPNGGAGVKKGTRYGGSKQNDTEEKNEKSEKNEAVEQIDELSPATLGSYVKKATSDVRMNTNMARNTTGKQSDKFAAKAWKREDNVGKAVDRITKEEVEQIDELSDAEVDKMYNAMMKANGNRLLKKHSAEVKKSKDIESGKELEKHVEKNPDVLKTYSNAVKKDKKMYGEEVEQIDELSPQTASNYLNKRVSQHNPNMNTPETNARDAKVARGIRGAISREHGYGPDKGAENKVTGRFEYRKKVGATHVFNKEEAEQIEEKKLRDTPGQEHMCAVHVKHSKLGEGKTLFSQHAEPDADGYIAWYDVMFAEEILRVNTKELEIIVSESHMNHKKK